jgi:hypothetical protein
MVTSLPPQNEAKGTKPQIGGKFKLGASPGLAPPARRKNARAPVAGSASRRTLTYRRGVRTCVRDSAAFRVRAPSAHSIGTMPPTLLLRPPSFRLPVSSRRANSASSYARSGPNSPAEPPPDGIGATAANDVDVDVGDGQAVLAALGALRSRRKAAAARAMAECPIAVLSNVLTKFLSTGQGRRRRRESALCASPSTTASARRAGCSGTLWRGCSVASKQRRALMTTT